MEKIEERERERERMNKKFLIILQKYAIHQCTARSRCQCRKYQSKLYNCYLVRNSQCYSITLVIFHILFARIIFPYLCLRGGYRRSKVSARYSITCRLKYTKDRKYMRYTCYRKVFYERSRIKEINVAARDLMETKTRRLPRYMLLTLDRPYRGDRN